MQRLLQKLLVDRTRTFSILALILGVLLRLVLTAYGWPQTNSDEDTMGLMALHIAKRGELPIFFYGQNYMGAFEAYLGAGLFRLFGASVFTLRLGTILLFALFLVCMYLLTSLLYTKKLAFIVLILLSFGSIVVLDTQLIALGGYPELLLFGSLSMLLASWLALTSGRYASWRRRCWRFIGYLCWGVVVGIGFWSDFLMGAFILASGLLLLLFCWRELLKGALLFLLLGFLLGALPLIVYNLNAPPGKGTLTELRNIHQNGSVELAQNHDYNQLPLIRETRGAMLIALPSATGGPTFCADSELRLFGHPSLGAFPCPHIFQSRRLTLLALVWSVGFVILWLVAAFQILKALWKLRPRRRVRTSSLEKRQAIIRYSARLLLLVSAGLTLGLFLSSPVSAVWPTNARYLIGLLVALPALLSPLWENIGTEKMAFNKLTGLSVNKSTHPPVGADLSSPSPIDRPSGTPATSRDQLPNPHNHDFQLNRTTIMPALKIAILLLIGLVFLLGTISAFSEIPTAQANAQQENVLISNLLRIRATHIYSEYWTCGRVIFLSHEQIICASLDNNLQPTHNRYPPYYTIVKADPNAAYVFPLGSAQASTFAKEALHSKRHYQRFVFNDYVVYLPG